MLLIIIAKTNIFRIIRDYGEDKFAKNIAKHISNGKKRKTIGDNSRTK